MVQKICITLIVNETSSFLSQCINLYTKDMWFKKNTFWGPEISVEDQTELERRLPFFTPSVQIQQNMRVGISPDKSKERSHLDTNICWLLCVHVGPTWNAFPITFSQALLSTSSHLTIITQLSLMNKRKGKLISLMRELEIAEAAVKALSNKYLLLDLLCRQQGTQLFCCPSLSHNRT